MMVGVVGRKMPDRWFDIVHSTRKMLGDAHPLHHGALLYRKNGRLSFFINLIIFAVSCLSLRQRISQSRGILQYPSPSQRFSIPSHNREYLKNIWEAIAFGWLRMAWIGSGWELRGDLKLLACQLRVREVTLNMGRIVALPLSLLFLKSSSNFEPYSTAVKRACWEKKSKKIWIYIYIYDSELTFAV